jgi:hypothetical protein
MKNKSSTISVILSFTLFVFSSNCFAQAADALTLLGQALEKAKHCTNKEGRVGEEFCKPARLDAIRHIRLAIDQMKKDMGQ